MNDRADGTLNRRLHQWAKDNQGEIWILVAGLAVIHTAFFAADFRGDTLDPQTADRFGSFVGGYFGTMVSLLSVVLLVKTLKAQQSTLRTQLAELESQRQSEETRTFESKYFTLLQLHRDNVSEMKIQRIEGRLVFVHLLYEWRVILPLVRNVARQTATALTTNEVAWVAYCCLFFGTGTSSSPMLRNALASSLPDDFVDRLNQDLGDDDDKRLLMEQHELAYMPLEGHQARLGHYFRHLYQAIRYVDEQTIAINKYGYVKTIRAQLSTHEQALLLINSLAPMGRPWWSDKQETSERKQQALMVYYRLVKNLPLAFFDADDELDISQLFPTRYFEWEEYVDHKDTQNMPF